MYQLDIENKDKHYLDEKELFILYWLLRKKHISTLWSGAFVPNGKYVIHATPSNPSDIATFEEDINNSIKQTLEKIQNKVRSSVVLKYLLNTGKLFDEQGFSVYGDADYSLVEGGFLSEEDENRNTVPVKAYKEAIINKKADKDFIELVNKLIVEYDGSKWNTEDIEKFLEIYYRHNKEEFGKNARTERTFLYEDNQTKLAGLIFEYTNFGLFIKNTEKLQNYFGRYIKSFVDNELNELSRKGLTGTFLSEGLSASLHSQFFGFKKQRDILVKHIEKEYEEYQRNDLEIGHPYFVPEYIGDDKRNEVKITISAKDKLNDLFLFVHTMIALEYENYLKIEDFFYGSTGIFDLYERGFVFKVRLNKEGESSLKQKLFDSYDKNHHILKFAGQEIELAKKGKETDAVLLLETLLKAEDSEWKHNDEILNDWGYNDEDLKDLPKNKVYFAGQKINNAVALKTQIDDFLECNTSKARINPKYRKVDE